MHLTEHTPDVEAKATGRRIEITPEMLDAGALALASYSPEWETHEDALLRTLAAMWPGGVLVRSEGSGAAAEAADQ